MEKYHNLLYNELNKAKIAYETAKQYNDTYNIGYENKIIEQNLLENYSILMNMYKQLLVNDIELNFGIALKKKNKLKPKRKSAKRKSAKRKSPKKGVNYSKKKIKSPRGKTVKDKKGNKKGKRLSARYIFNKHGKGAIGQTFNILQSDGTYKSKYLRLRQNGSPYFSTKFGA